MSQVLQTVIPAKAGIQVVNLPLRNPESFNSRLTTWIPAFAGMTRSNITQSAKQILKKRGVELLGIVICYITHECDLVGRSKDLYGTIG